MSNYLILSALGDNRADLLSALVRTVLDCKCSIVDSRMSVLGRKYSLIMLLTGNWNTLAKLEVQLERLAQPGGDLGELVINVQRTEDQPARDDVLPYAVETVALDEPGVLYRQIDFFASRGVHIEELSSRSYSAMHTGAAMCTVNLVIGVPSGLHLAMLREEFMDFCDQYNWDSVLEPVKT